ncbi:hypothetical protein GCM10009730_20520 [Streptomyces albidochromogenes]
MEASIVTVRRGMERQYGTGLSVHRWGRSVRGHGRRTYGRAGSMPRQTAPEPEWDFSIASRNRA